MTAASPGRPYDLRVAATGGTRQSGTRSEGVEGTDGGGGQSPASTSVNGTGGPVVDLGLPQLAAAIEIGRGSSGVVYRAEQPGINRTVAVKMLSSVMDAAPRTLFERETRAMGALSSHPNIVTVFDAG